MSWESETAAKLTEYRGAEYSNDEQARKCVVAAYGTWLPDDMLATAMSIPAHKREDLDRELAHRMSAVENLSTSVGWSKDMLRRV